MIAARDQVFGEHLGVIEHVLDRPHRRAGHALAEDLLPFQRTALGERSAQFRHDFGGMRGAAALVAQRGSRASSGRPTSSHNAAKKWFEWTEI